MIKLLILIILTALWLAIKSDNILILNEKLKKNEIYGFSDLFKDLKLIPTFIFNIIVSPVNFALMLIVSIIIYMYILYVIVFGVLLILWRDTAYIRNNKKVIIVFFKAPFLASRYITENIIHFLKWKNIKLLLNRLTLSYLIGFSVKILSMANDFKDNLINSLEKCDKNFSIRVYEVLNIIDKYVENNIIEKILLIEKKLKFDKIPALIVIGCMEIDKKYIKKQSIDDITFIFEDNHIKIKCKTYKIEKAIEYIETKKKDLKLNEKNIIYWKKYKLNSIILKLISNSWYKNITLSLTFENYNSVDLTRKVFFIKNNDDYQIGDISELGEYSFYYKELNKYNKKKMSMVKNKLFFEKESYSIDSLTVKKANKTIILESKKEDIYLIVEAFYHYLESNDKNTKAWLELEKTFRVENISKGDMIEILNNTQKDIIKIYIEYNIITFIDEAQKLLFIEKEDETTKQAIENAIKKNI